MVWQAADVDINATTAKPARQTSTALHCVPFRESGRRYRLIVRALENACALFGRAFLKRGTRMKLPRRRFLHLAGAAAIPAMSGIARTQPAPTSPPSKQATR